MQFVEARAVRAVEMTSSTGNVFTRYSPGAWTVRMGDSDEPVNWDDQLMRLESAYAKWVSVNGPPGERP